MKQPAKLIITILAACFVILLANHILVEWVRGSDSDKRTEERERQEWDSASISRLMNMKKWECGSGSNPRAVKAALKKGTLWISGKGAMRDFRACRGCYSCVGGGEYVDATLEKKLEKDNDSTSNVEPLIIDIGRGGRPIRHTSMPCCIGAWSPWYMSNFADSITDAVVKNGVTDIGEMAFVGLYELKSVSIPASVSSISKAAFNICSGWSVSDCGDYNLVSIDVAAGNAHYSSVDGILFNKDKTTLILYPSDKQQDAYTIPNSVTEIEERAFIRTRLKSVTIPHSVTKIGRDAFAYSDLTSVAIPGSVTAIGESTFQGCVRLASATIEEGVASIGMYAFMACTSLTSIKIPRSVVSVGQTAFEDCIGLTSVAIENGVTAIGGEAFGGCAKLTSITLPASVTSIESVAFYGCKNLTSIIILNPVPPDVNDETFLDVSPKVRLYVPKGSVNAYRRAWRSIRSGFESVNEIAGAIYTNVDTIGGR